MMTGVTRGGQMVFISYRWMRRDESLGISPFRFEKFMSRSRLHAKPSPNSEHPCVAHTVFQFYEF